MTAATTYATRQLTSTLKWAAEHSQFYRERFISGLGSFDITEQTAWSALSAMPPTTKSDLLEQVHPVLHAADDFITELTRSSGTSGLQSIRFRSRYELALIDDLLSDVADKNDAEITLEFVNSYHGKSRAVGPGIQIPVDVTNKASTEAAIHMLRGSFNLPRTQNRITSLAGTVNNILQFTHYLIFRQITSAEFSVRRIISSGSYLSRRSAKVIENFWNIAPVNTFSLSEARGAAAVCPHCGALQFAAHLVPSAIRLHSNEPLASGYGRLCVTELLPFGLCQPLVKFLTGDLVEVISDPCSDLHRGSVRRVGRTSDCLFKLFEPNELLLTSQDLYESVDIPTVCREEVWLNYIHELPSKFFGQPVARVSVELQKKPIVHVEIKVANGDVTETCDVVRARLLEFSRELRKAVADEEIELTVSHNPTLTAGLKK